MATKDYKCSEIYEIFEFSEEWGGYIVLAVVHESVAEAWVEYYQKVEERDVVLGSIVRPKTSLPPNVDTQKLLKLKKNCNQY